MKGLTRKLLVLGAVGTLMTGASTAMAAEGTEAPAQPQIAVQLDGTPLTFTDAAPQVKDSRTFLPFRAVFEAMGAQVSNEGSVITATREGKTVTMTIGSTQATVTEGEVVTPLTMDVAPYVDNTTWRTYVPVRFAAQALDCAVGWDQEAYTAVIVDTNKLLDAALEGKHFTYLEKYMDYAQKYNEGIWNTDMTMTGGMTISDEATVLSIPMGVTASGVTQDSTALEMGMNMTLDMTQLLELIEADAAQNGVTEGAVTEADAALFQSLATEGIGIQMRGDLDKGTFAMTMSGSALEASGMSANTWYTIDLAKLYGSMGVDYTQFIAAAKEIDYAQLIRASLRETSVDDVEAYAELKETAELLVGLCCDEAFVKDGDNYTTGYTLQEEDGEMAIFFTLTMKEDKVVGYAMRMSMDVTEGGGVAEDGTPIPATTVHTNMDMAVDEKDVLSGEMVMTVPELLDAQFTITGSYAEGTTAPQTQVPAGATVVDLNLLMDSVSTAPQT